MKRRKVDRARENKKRRGEEERCDLLSDSKLFLIILISSAQTQTYEIILTLGQAFEVAYQVAVQSRARQYVPPSSLHSEVVETKTSRPVCPSWSSMRRSAVSTALQAWACIFLGGVMYFFLLQPPVLCIAGSVCECCLLPAQ